MYVPGSPPLVPNASSYGAYGEDPNPAPIDESAGQQQAGQQAPTWQEASGFASTAFNDILRAIGTIAMTEQAQQGAASAQTQAYQQQLQALMASGQPQNPAVQAQLAQLQAQVAAYQQQVQAQTPKEWWQKPWLAIPAGAAGMLALAWLVSRVVRPRGVAAYGGYPAANYSDYGDAYGWAA